VQVEVEIVRALVLGAALALVAVGASAAIPLSKAAGVLGQPKLRSSKTLETKTGVVGTFLSSTLVGRQRMILSEP